MQDYAVGMRILQRLIGAMLRPAAERQARGKTFSDLANELGEAWPRIETHLKGKPDTGMNREALAHCIGIERWGQSRLKVGLGEPFTLDAYHPYRPNLEDGVDALAQAMKETREATIALAHDLEAKGVPVEKKVEHNDLGEMSLGAWLMFLKQHASRELPLRVRG